MGGVRNSASILLCTSEKIISAHGRLKCHAATFYAHAARLTEGKVAIHHSCEAMVISDA
jgi:hypothetical protein